jgi:cysteinyl-tRNA synthetase
VLEEAAADVPADIQALAQQRWDAKQAKDWGTADTLRKELEAAGWLIKDSKEGFSVVPKS